MTFRESAQAETCLSTLMTGKDAVKTLDIIRNYPDGVTIKAFDLVTMTNKKTKKTETVPVIVCEEMPDKFFFGGTVLAQIVTKWVAMCEGDIKAASDGVASEHIRIKMARATTSNGNDITTVTIL